MLPKFSRDIPELLKKTATSDLSAVALIAKSDTHIADWKKEITEMAFLKLSERCPFHLLGELGYMLSAGMLEFDSETAKRIKIFSAIKRHKTRGSWENDAKAIVDAIAGGNSNLVSSYFEGEWILYGKELGDPIDYAATMGKDGIDDDLGIDLIGRDGTEPDIKGIVGIDCDNDSLTADEIEALVINLRYDILPVYMRIILGYFDSITGFWTAYAGGTID